MVLNEYSRNLHAGVDCSTHWSTKGIPRLVVKPGDEFLPAVIVEVFSGAEVEVRIELMDDWTYLSYVLLSV